MSSTSIASISVIILAVILVDIFCADVTNIGLTSPRQNNQSSGQKSPDILLDKKSTTPWPALGQRRTEIPNFSKTILQATRVPTTGPKKWIQQNNIWIRNEQSASGAGDSVAPQNGNSNQQGTRQQSLAAGNTNFGNNGQRLRGQQPSSGAINNNNQRGTTQSNPKIYQTNRQQALINGLGGNQENLGGQQKNIDTSNINNNRENIHTNRNSESNKQQALINGLGGNQPNLGLVNPSSPNEMTNSKPLGPFSVPGGTSNSATSPNKPMSYAGAVGLKNPIPFVPKTPASPPLNPQRGEPKKDIIPSTGPIGDNEHLDDNEDINIAKGDVTDEELREFSEMLLRKDSNNAMKYVTLNLQGMTTSRSPNDEAPEPLLKVQADAYKIPSIEKLMLLYNNYFLDASQNEVYTGAERIEENNFLDTVLATPVMQYARSFLIQKGKIGKDPKEFKDLLRLIWFNMYSRGQGRIGSSGFEHVFLAEIKNNKVSGLHNWVYFNEEESQKRVNYLGYLKKLDLGEKGAILKYHFTVHDIDKPVGGMFIGTSPELELAVYSTCFILRADKICPLKMNGNRFIIRTYTYRYRGKNLIGSAFPEI